MNQKKLTTVIKKYKNHISNSNEIEAINERNKRMEYYQSWTEERIINMFSDEFAEYIGKLWSMIVWGNKKYIADKIGEQYVIPTLGVWDKFEDINFNELPNQFVLKCTHDSGGLVVCKDKSKLDLKKARKKIEKSLANNYYLWTREWPYKGVKPRIIAEKYMEDQETGELRDYKFFCFNGEPKLMFVATERGVKNTKFDFYDMQFNHMNIVQHYPNSVSAIRKPEHFEKMIELTKKLSEGFPHVRVDFYEANGQVYFGEMTFYHFGAIVPFETKEWDKKIGDWLVLPEKIS